MNQAPRRAVGGLLCALLAAPVAGSAARAQVVYPSPAASGAEWTRADTETAPGGATFRGRFGNQPVRLTLASLSAHTDVTVAFDVHVIGRWEGNTGRDVFTVKSSGGRTLLQTSFSNTDAPQAYPEAAPYSDYPARKDAMSSNTLGYAAPGDSTYRVTRAFPHTGGRLDLEFAATGLPDGATWGLDNVRVVLSTRTPGDLVSNGDFEAPSVAASSSQTPEDLYGWTVTDGDAALRNGAGAGSGEQYLDLRGTVAQEVPVAAGRQYRLQFRLAGEDASAQARVTWDGRDVATLPVEKAGGGTPGWRSYEYLVTGPEAGRRARLAFQAEGAGGFLLDAVSLSPVAPADINLSGAADLDDAAQTGRLFLGLAEGDPYMRLRADAFPFAGMGGRQHGDGWLTLEDVPTALALAEGRMGYLPMAEAAVNDLYTHFWIGTPTDGYIMPAWGGRPDRDHPYGSVWEHAQMLRTMMDLYRVNHDPALLRRIRLHWTWMVDHLGSDLTTVGAGTNMNWSDDAGWSTLMYLDVYRLTKDPEALAMAKTLFNNVYERWVDDTYGGGQWYTDEHNQKAVYQVSQILTGLRIYDITGDASFRDRSLSLYRWVDSHLARGKGLYYVDYDRNGPVKKNGPPEEASSDTMLAGNMAMAVTAARIYRATGDRKYLDSAVQTANAILAVETKGGGEVLMNDRDANVEGFYVADWVAEVLSLPGVGPEQADILRRTAASIYVNARTPEGYYSGNWSGPSHGPLAAWGKPGRGFRPEQIMISSNSVHMIVGAAALGVLKPEPARPF